jgi:hypothetical protein
MELNIIKNTEAAPYMGSRFGQDVEPKGVYVIEKDWDGPINHPWVQGKVTLNNPMIIPVSDETLVSWKYEISNQFKAKGKKLTDKLMAKGFDGIITKYSDGKTGEIILFPNSNFMLSENKTKTLIKKMLKEKLNEIKIYQGHKIPVENIFKNANLHNDRFNSEISKKIDVWVDDETFKQNNVEWVDVNKIVPTQKFIDKENLKSVKGIKIGENTGAYLVEYGGLYYVIDGHHRLASQIMQDVDSLKAYVQHI